LEEDNRPAREDPESNPIAAGVQKAVALTQAFDARKMEMLLHRKCDLAA